jgi:DNA-binding response OmpR family regulator
MDKVWGLNFDTGTNLIDVYVNYLRNKINAPGSKKMIETIHGQGYRLNSTYAD